MADQISGTIVKQRAARLRELGEAKLHEFSHRFVGSELNIVVEAGESDGLCKGLSQNYLSIAVPAESVEPGKMIKVKITAQCQDGLLGEPVAGPL
jgi:threonylcarbamoyladenosine tRNA methylthiotransferase MtaB